jgi:pimeloyl-ACP methyl ester carboxylesterase
VIKNTNAGALSVAYVEEGESSGWPAVLLHGFPYDIEAYSEVSKRLAAAGARVVVPYLRGFGATRFLSSETPRSGQQAALGLDVVALLDALTIPSAVLAGYDWGGRGACVVSALWPERVTGLVSCGSYNIHDVAGALKPDTPDNEHRLWYQYYFHSERGRAALTKDRKSFCRLLWQLWSPTWTFDDASFEKTSLAFDNPDFVEVVIHSYRYRYGLVAGDPALEEMENLLARLPDITVPAITIDGADDGIRPAGSASHAKRFTGSHEHRVIPGAGHNVPQEAPEAFAAAVIAVKEAARSSRIR